MRGRRNQTMLIVIPLATLTLSCITGKSVPGSNQRGTAQVQSIILGAEQATEYFRTFAHCDPRVTQSVESYWTPSDTLKALLDEQVTRALTNALASRSSYRVADYYVQYMGIVRNGRRIVWANGIHRDHTDHDWTQYPIVVCDAGIAAFRSEYGLDTGTMSSISFSTRFGP
jgi:hypothetical protein